MEIFASNRRNKRKEMERITMRMKLVASLGTAILFLLVMPAIPVWAHHAFSAEFDTNKPIRLEGKIAKVEWVNPHAWIHVDVTKPDGTVEHWMIEGGTPNALFRRGVTKDTLTPGTAIIVSGYQAKDGTLKGNGRDLTLPDGRKLFVGSTGTGAPEDPEQK
jgi:Family of unknown function (DUF6152)